MFKITIYIYPLLAYLYFATIHVCIWQAHFVSSRIQRPDLQTILFHWLYALPLSIAPFLDFSSFWKLCDILIDKIWKSCEIFKEIIRLKYILFIKIDRDLYFRSFSLTSNWYNRKMFDVVRVRIALTRRFALYTYFYDAPFFEL